MSNKPNSFKKLEEKEFPAPSPLKPEYRDIPNDQWIPMDSVLPDEVKGNWFANKKCWIKNSKTGKIWYPDTFSLNSCKKYQNIRINGKYYLVHILLAKLFLVNDDLSTKIYVDHCNSISMDLKLDNLRWATPSENNKNRSKIREKERFYYEKYTLDGKLIEVILYKDIPQDIKMHIAHAVKYREGKYKKHIYKRIDINVREYSEIYGPPDPNGWKESRFPGVFCNIKGYLLINGIVTIGTLTPSGYYRIEIFGKSYFIHKLIYETFKNNNQPLNAEEVIDHIDSIRIPFVNNNINNLRKTDQKGNMNNINTKKKTSKPVSKIDPITGNILKTYYSITEAAKDNNIKSPSNISISCIVDNRLAGKFLWMEEGREKERWERYKKTQITDK